MLLALLSFKYPYLSLILFLTTSFVKTNLILEVSFFRFVDYTVLCAALLTFMMFYSFIKKGGKLKGLMSGGVVLYTLLVIILFLDCLYTSSPKWGFQKSVSFGTFSFVAFLAPIFFTQSVKDIKLMLLLLFLSGLIIAGGLIFAPHATTFRANVESRAGFLEASTITSASFIAMSFIIAYCTILSTGSNKLIKLICLFLLIPMAYAMIASGSRGPFIGLAMCIITTLLLSYGRVNKIAYLIIPIMILVLGIVMFIKMPEEKTKRVSSVFQSGSLEEQTLSRTVLFKTALKGGFKSPLFGNGTGSFAMDYTGIDEPAHPHNIFLELFYENGFPSVMITIAFFIYIFRYCIKSRRLAKLYFSVDIQWMIDIIILLIFFAFIQANKSAAISGQRPLFFSCGLIIAAYGVMSTAVERDRQLATNFQDNEFLFEND